MSVYTPVTVEELDAWLARYGIGTRVELAPIADGIENTNYFLTTTKGCYVLTLYERLPADELPFYLNLMAHLARAGVECPAPEPDRTGALFSVLNGKPASIVTRVDGVPMPVPDAVHCASVGAALARLHIASATYRARLTNRRGPGWWRQAARAVRPFLDADRNELLAAEIRFQTGFGKVKLPKAAIHGDLFCDNVLFVGDRVSGIVDFGFAATDFLAYDLAITVNDWCIVRDGDAMGALVPELVAALTGAYDAVRPLTPDERTQWPALLRAAALRFWLSRLYDLHLPRPGELVHAHDPAHFERILRDRVQRPTRLPDQGTPATADAERATP
ncbi:MAG: homoserine kinase [Betaproteobacteria bacterium]